MIDFDDIDNFFCSSSTKKRVQFSLAKSYNTLCGLLDGLHEHGEQWRLVSPRGGWSSCSLLEYIANETTVHNCFNENPKIEQFCITNDASVYDWYLSIMKKVE